MKKEKIYTICVWTLLCDQIIKVLITLKLKLYQTIVVIPNFFDIYYLTNKGGAFSIFENASYFFIIFAICIFIILQQYIKKASIKSSMEITGLGLLMGGLVGNLVDRLLYGHVIDYLSFHIFKYSFPVFNIADIAIVVGVFLFFIDSIKDKSKTKKISKSK